MSVHGWVVWLQDAARRDLLSWEVPLMMFNYKTESLLKPGFLSRLDEDSELLPGVPLKHFIFLHSLLPVEDRLGFLFCCSCWAVAWRSGVWVEIHLVMVRPKITFSGLVVFWSLLWRLRHVLMDSWVKKGKYETAQWLPEPQVVSPSPEHSHIVLIST